jgi:hypothetical protein
MDRSRNDHAWRTLTNQYTTHFLLKKLSKSPNLTYPKQTWPNLI